MKTTLTVPQPRINQIFATSAFTGKDVLAADIDEKSAGLEEFVFDRPFVLDNNMKVVSVVGGLKVDHINDVAGAPDGANAEIVYSYTANSLRNGGSFQYNQRRRVTEQPAELAAAFKAAGCDIPVKTPLGVRVSRGVAALRQKFA